MSKKPIVMFEKAHKGGTITALFVQGDEYPFSFMYSKGDQYKACLPCDNLAGCWAWLDQGMKLDNKTIV